MAGGRPSFYKTNIKGKLKQIEAWARDGLVNEQIAKNLGINVATLYKYKAANAELDEALKRGKEVVDIEVENALYKRALGYKFNEVTKELIKNTITGESELITTKVVTKEVAADTTAQIFWLKNRKPVEWRDRKEIDQTNHNIEVVLTDEERKKRLEELRKKLGD